MAAPSTPGGSPQEIDVPQCLATCFRGLEQPKKEQECFALITSGVVFLQQLTLVDPVFKMIYADFKDQVEGIRSPEQAIKNWQALGAALFDHGLEIGPEAGFAILAGQWATAAQLAMEIQRLPDKSFAMSRTVLVKVGPEIAVRHRLHPFMGTAAPPVAAPPAAGAANVAAPAALAARTQQPGQRLPLGGGAGAAASSKEPTRLLVQDPQRFQKKRAYVVEQMERLKERELRAQRLKEKREREAARIAAEAAKTNELAQELAAQEQYLRDSLLLYRSDPAKLAEKKRKTELLRELEVLEAQAAADQRKMQKLARAKETGRMESPKRPHVASSELVAAATNGGITEKRKGVSGTLSPVRIRDTGSIPFSYHNRGNGGSTTTKSGGR